MKWCYHRRCLWSQVYRLARMIWASLSWMVTSWGDRGCRVSAPPQSYAFSGTHRSASWSSRSYHRRYHSWWSQILFFRWKWNWGKWMSYQARKNVYEKSWIYRRSQGFSWENYGFTLSHRKKRLSWASWTNVWMTCIPCAIWWCDSCRATTRNLWRNRSRYRCSHDGTNPGWGMSGCSSGWFLATHQNCDEKTQSSPHRWWSTDGTRTNRKTQY